MGWCFGTSFTSERQPRRNQSVRNWLGGIWPEFPKQRMHIVLVEPEIPPNTGNVARLCAATRTVLHLIEPLGFKLDDSQLKRAGMDYWEQVEWHRWLNWEEFCKKLQPGQNIWFVESG